MIYLKKGDLLSHVGTIIHSTNIEGIMGAGVAAYIRRVVPGAFEVYKKQISESEVSIDCLGFYSVFHDTENNRSIVNLNGQSIKHSAFWNYPQTTHSVMTNYHALDAGFERLAVDLARAGFPTVSLGFPMIGCGLGGASWRVVSALI